MSERPLSILHVIASLAPRYGGPAKVAELCEALAERGNRVEIATTNIDGPFDLEGRVGGRRLTPCGRGRIGRYSIEAYADGVVDACVRSVESKVGQSRRVGTPSAGRS